MASTSLSMEARRSGRCIISSELSGASAAALRGTTSMLVTWQWKFGLMARCAASSLRASWTISARSASMMGWKRPNCAWPGDDSHASIAPSFPAGGSASGGASFSAMRLGASTLNAFANAVQILAIAHYLQ